MSARPAGLGISMSSKSNNSPTDITTTKAGKYQPPKTKPGAALYASVPGFVIKAVRPNSSEKIFINVYQTAELPDDGMVLKAFEPSEHRGSPCTVCPVLLSTAYLARTADIKFLEQVVLQILLQINLAFPSQCVDTVTVKLPKVKKGFVGGGPGSGAGGQEEQSTFSKKLKVHTIVLSGQRLQMDNEDEEVKRDDAPAPVPLPVVAAAATPAPAPSPIPVPAGPSSAKATAAAASAKTSPSAPAPVPVPAPSPVSTSPSPAAAVPAAGRRPSTSSSPPPPLAVPLSPAAPPVPSSSSSDPITPTTTPTPPLTPPPKMVGWLQKRGHLVKNWKTRHFVLNQGSVVYYTDASPVAPFGEHAKGLLCLAGYKDLKDTATGIRRTSIFRRASAEGGDLQIHLVLDPSAIAALLPEHSDTKKMLTSTLSSAQTALGMRTSEGVGEFLIECGTLTEKIAWTAAIEAHTAYVEAVLRMHLNNNRDKGMGDVSRRIDPLNFTSDSDGSQAQWALTMPPEETHGPLPVIPVPAVTPIPVPSSSSPKAYTTLGQQQTSRASLSGRSMTSTATRSKSMVGRNNKFLHLVRGEEIVHMSGMVNKSNAFGMGILCDLVLLVNKNLDLDGAETNKDAAAMRLLIVDANSYKQEAEIVWRRAGPQPSILNCKSADKYFSVKDTSGKVFRFTPQDKVTAHEWATAIDALMV